VRSQKCKKLQFLETSTILANLYFVPEGFQSTVKGIFIPKNLKLGKLIIKKLVKLSMFYFLSEGYIYTKYPLLGKIAL